MIHLEDLKPFLSDETFQIAQKYVDEVKSIMKQRFPDVTDDELSEHEELMLRTVAMTEQERMEHAQKYLDELEEFEND